MNASAFDPATFETMEQTAEFSTTVIPCPIGEYQGVIDKVSSQPAPSVDSSPLMNILWNIPDEKAKKETGKDKVIVKQAIWLDFNDAGDLDFSKGKNVALGRLLEALGLNGKPWSPASLVGRIATVQVSHRPDKTDPSITYDQVARVAAAK